MSAETRFWTVLGILVAVISAWLAYLQLNSSTEYQSKDRSAPKGTPVVAELAIGNSSDASDNPETKDDQPEINSNPDTVWIDNYYKRGDFDLDAAGPIAKRFTGSWIDISRVISNGETYKKPAGDCKSPDSVVTYKDGSIFTTGPDSFPSKERVLNAYGDTLLLRLPYGEKIKLVLSDNDRTKTVYEDGPMSWTSVRCD